MDHFLFHAVGSPQVRINFAEKNKNKESILSEGEARQKACGLENKKPAARKTVWAIRTQPVQPKRQGPLMTSSLVDPPLSDASEAAPGGPNSDDVKGKRPAFSSMWYIWAQLSAVLSHSTGM